MGKISNFLAKLRSSEDPEEVTEAQQKLIDQAKAQRPVVTRARRDARPETEFVVTRRRLPIPADRPPYDPKSDEKMPFNPPAVDVEAPEHYTKMGSKTRTIVVQTGELAPLHVATTTTLFLDKRVYPHKRLLHATVVIG